MGVSIITPCFFTTIFCSLTACEYPSDAIGSIDVGTGSTLLSESVRAAIVPVFWIFGAARENRAKARSLGAKIEL